MIILDTNALSEMLNPRANEIFARWVRSVDSSELYTTTIAQAEVLFAVELLPQGRRRAVLAKAVRQIFEEDFAERILPFDSAAAGEYAAIAARRRRSGRPIGSLDAQIAAITRWQRAILATRNVRDFQDCEVQLINPWER